MNVAVRRAVARCALAVFAFVAFTTARAGPLSVQDFFQIRLINLLQQVMNHKDNQPTCKGDGEL